MFSRNGTKVYICIFDETGAHELARFELANRSRDVHFGFVRGFKAGCLYGFRVEGPWAPEHGMRFDSSKLLVDPYGLRFHQAFEYHSDLTQRGIDTAVLMPKCVAQSALPDAPRLPFRSPEFIYELPVKAFTMLHPDVPLEKRGTVAALAEPAVIEHLVMLGVDTVELMPITAWIDERHLPPLGLHNAWGYNPVNFFAPDPRLAPGGIAEVRESVSNFHKHGIRVILDIVLNHSGESDQYGPTLCLRGFDNAVYYAQSNGTFINDTGCGNTLALNDPHVMQMVIDSLRHWVLKAGVDGFRFDLATVMGRMPNGFSSAAPLLQAIEADPILSTCIMIAEPWDIGPGGYQLGQFPARWFEWNDKFRDDVRKFWRGDSHSANQLATRLTGSSDIFVSPRKPSNSINFLAAHDGFTMRDVVIYSDKNNYNNGEDNRDGKSGEITWPGGDVRALLATLFLSRGTPMLTAGDEFGRTQLGNNNAYAQDNALTWLDWSMKDDALIAEVAKLVRLRKSLAAISADQFLLGRPDPTTGITDAVWFGRSGELINWSATANTFVGLALSHGTGRVAVVLNCSADNVEMQFPSIAGTQWFRIYSSSPDQGCPGKSVSVFVEQDC